MKILKQILKRVYSMEVEPKIVLEKDCAFNQTIFLKKFFSIYGRQNIDISLAKSPGSSRKSIMDRIEDLGQEIFPQQVLVSIRIQDLVILLMIKSVNNIKILFINKKLKKLKH
jgi:hypothetical protein